MDSQDNVIEWLTGDKTARVTFTQQKYIHRIERMAEKHGDAVRIIHKNNDGSVYAEIPSVCRASYDLRSKCGQFSKRGR